MSRPAQAGSAPRAVGGALRRGQALFDLLKAAWVEYERDHARYLAVAMVYYALVSLVPLLLLLLAALGLLLRFSATAVKARQQMLGGIEARFGPELSVTITGLLHTLQQDSIIATIIGLGGLLLTASVLFRHLRLSFRAIWKYEPPLVSGSIRDIVRLSILEKVISFVMVLAGGGLLLTALILIAATQWLYHLLGRVPSLGQNTGFLLAAVSALILAVITFASLFKVLPPVPIRWRQVWLAALLCAVSWVVASELLAFSGFLFGKSPSAFGAFGGVLAGMLWMNVVSQALFFGAELCKVVATQSKQRGRHTPPPTGC